MQYQRQAVSSIVQDLSHGDFTVRFTFYRVRAAIFVVVLELTLQFERGLKSRLELVFFMK